jgi:hypothetical protein
MPLWGKTDVANKRPKFLKVDNNGVVTEGPSIGKKLVFIDEAEAAKTSNKNKGITGTGWYLINDKSGRTRAELVVAVTNAPGGVADASEPVEDSANIDTED